MVVMGTFFRFFESKNRYKWIKKPARRMRHQVKSVTYVKLEATDEQVDPTERQAVKAVVPETPPVQEYEPVSACSVNGRPECLEYVIRPTFSLSALDASTNGLTKRFISSTTDATRRAAGRYRSDSV